MKETILAQSDEFKIVQDDSEFVHVVDGEGTIRLTMNRSTLDNLVNQLLTQRLVSNIQEIAQQKTCFEIENDENNYVEFLDDGRENDNFYPNEPSIVFEDGENYGRVTLARSILGQPDNSMDAY